MEGEFNRSTSVKISYYHKEDIFILFTCFSAATPLTLVLVSDSPDVDRWYKPAIVQLFQLEFCYLHVGVFKNAINK